MPARRRFTDEFKDEAVRRVVESSRPVPEVARELQIAERTLRAWVARYRSFVPPDIPARLEALLADTVLPDPLPLGRPVNIYYEIAESLAEERTSRGIYQVLAGYDGGYFIDCCVEVQSPMLISGHRRIREDGTVEDLEQLERTRQFSDPADAQAERLRVGEHNDRVGEILRAKGFG